MMTFFEILGGMALFLYGVNILSKAMEKVAGSQIQHWLDRMTNHVLKAALFGTVATAILQSSSMLMVTMISLINANLMTLSQAVGVMMGQEIGTTLTAQIVAFDVGNICFIFIALGFVLIEFWPHSKIAIWGEIIFGFGVLFLGMEMMSDSLKLLMVFPQVEGFLTVMGQNIFLGVLAGTIATAVIQSSSAVTALVVAMGISQTITLDGAIALLLGANIGTCITGLIAAFRLSRPALRASLAQIFINIVGVMLFLPFIGPFSNLVSHTALGLSRQIANAHSIFNIVVSAIMLPFTKKIVDLVEWVIPVKEEESQEKITKFIDEGQLGFPAIALDSGYKELLYIGEITNQMVTQSYDAFVQKNITSIEWILDREEELVDPATRALDHFVNLLLREDLTVEEQERAFLLKNLLVDIERVADLVENIAQSSQEKINGYILFTPDGWDAVGEMIRHTIDTFTVAMAALQKNDVNLAKETCKKEDEFDEMYLVEKQAHIERLNHGLCSPAADVMFVELLRHLERINDHAENIAIGVIRTNRM
jgi:phosphate:Na+ symporter